MGPAVPPMQAGLGRLVWELATRGFNSQGNEWSTFMLLASNYILNGMGAMTSTSLGLINAPLHSSRAPTNGFTAVSESVVCSTS